jgi:hypothetical protein
MHQGQIVERLHIISRFRIQKPVLPYPCQVSSSNGALLDLHRDPVRR